MKPSDLDGASLTAVDLVQLVAGPFERATSRGVIRVTCERCLDRVHPEALVLTDAGVRCEDCAAEVADD